MTPTKSKSGIRATNVEIFSRKLDNKTSDSLYLRDADDLYPLRIEKLINNSPTGRRCANLMAKYIVGNGNVNNFQFSSGRFINDVLRSAAVDISTQYGVYFRLRKIIDTEKTTADNIVFKNGDVEVLDYVPMARSKVDDNGFSGKFYFLKEEKGKFKKNKDAWFYPYSNIDAVIKEQMMNDCKIKGIKEPTIQQMVQSFRGQVYYLNLTPKYIYSLSLADSVYNDLDTEFRISTYNNTQTRTGFLGKTIVVKYADDDLENSDFNTRLKSFLGAENSGEVFVVDVPEGVEADLESAFVVKQLEAQFDDKLFESTVKQLRQNILGAFNNIPEPLIFSSSSALFGTSADTYTEMKKFYWEQNEYERSILEQTIRMFGFECNILPIVNEMPENEQEIIRAKAQAELKGSVGGVTALIQLQQSVALGTTDVNSAVEIIKEIYGIGEETARKMLGTPETINTESDGLQ